LKQTLYNTGFTKIPIFFQKGKWMKSEERRELKTNELADWIMNFPEWAKENTGTIAYVIVLLIIVAVVAYIKWYRPAHATSREQLEMSALVSQLEIAKLQLVASKSTTPQNPEMIRTVADRLDSIAVLLTQPEYAALALIKRGEALRAELHYAPVDFAKDPNALAFQIDKARNCYQQALEKADGNPQLEAAAQFGLGLCQEELGNFEDAQRIYQDIIKNENYAGTAIWPMARDRSADMADYKGKFVFIEKPKPAAPAPSMPLGPRIQPAPQAPTPTPAPAPVKPAETNSAPAK
jgi:tetratricopeptide (TPR) repeat protein